MGGARRVKRIPRRFNLIYPRENDQARRSNLPAREDPARPGEKEE